MKKTIQAVLVSLALAWGASHAQGSTATPIPKAALDVAKASAVELYEQGLPYCRSENGPVDFGEAAKWFRLSADKGYANAQFRLGVFYERGTGVPQDYAKAFNLLKLAAAQGHAAASAGVGNYYTYGTGGATPVNRAEALKWHRKAASRGHLDAQETLVRQLYLGENGNVTNYAEAAKWARKAAAQGSSASQGVLAGMHHLGQGMPRNPLKAYMWASLSAAQGNETGAGLRNLAEDGLTKAQLAKAQDMAQACLARNYANCD